MIEQQKQSQAASIRQSAEQRVVQMGRCAANRKKPTTAAPEIARISTRRFVAVTSRRSTDPMIYRARRMPPGKPDPREEPPGVFLICTRGGGAGPPSQFRRAADFVDKILRGAK